MSETEQQQPEQPQLDPLVRVWICNATRTSAGSGPGYKMLPRAEAGALIAARLASQHSPDDVLLRQVQSMQGPLRAR